MICTWAAILIMLVQWKPPILHAGMVRNGILWVVELIAVCMRLQFQVIMFMRVETFTLAGGLSVSSLARWNKNTKLWSALGNFENGGYSPEIYALAVATNGDLYVGGEFVSVDGISAFNVAYYSNTTGWHALGSGISCSPAPCNSSVNALLVDGGTVYAGGEFNVAGGFGVNNLAKWNGSSWSNVGGGVGGFYHIGGCFRDQWQQPVCGRRILRSRSRGNSNRSHQTWRSGPAQPGIQ